MDGVHLLVCESPSSKVPYSALPIVGSYEPPLLLIAAGSTERGSWGSMMRSVPPATGVSDLDALGDADELPFEPDLLELHALNARVATATPTIKT